ncbi:MAG: rubrerythrin family protein [Candidatus Hodarchaeota archaeon]
MAKHKEAKTRENLRSVFAGESQANRRYLAFAKKAEEEGYPEIARLFRIAAFGETIHAFNHLKVLGVIKSTEENLLASFKGEEDERLLIYPAVMSQAEADEDMEAYGSFELAKKVEEIHQKMFEDAYSKLKAGEDIEPKKYFVCPTCGYPATPVSPKSCPVCGTKGSKFIESESEIQI